MSEKLITVIIPTYGRAKLIECAIMSVLNQSYKNIEIIIVDDNGLDTVEQKKTYSIVSNYIERGGRIKYIPHKKNKNGSAARNTGIKHASGEYICFLDDDDEFYKDKLMKQYLYLESLDHEWAACYCGHKRCFKDKTTRLDYIYEPVEEGDLTMGVLCSTIDICGGSTLMIRREILDNISGFNESLRRHQDYEFMVRLAFTGKVAVISEPLVKINVHEGSYRSRKYEDIVKDRVDYFLSIQKYIERLSRKERKKVYYCNNYELLKQSLKHRKIPYAIKYFVSCKKPITTILKLINDTVKYISKE